MAGGGGKGGDTRMGGSGWGETRNEQSRARKGAGDGHA